MPNTIDDLREHLFATLKGLRDPENPMEIDHAKAIAEVAGKIIESAKAENQYLQLTGQTAGSGFIPLPAPAKTEQPGQAQPRLVKGRDMRG